MILILAQVASPPIYSEREFYAVVGVILLILAVAVMLKMLKREPPLHREYMARAECEKQHADIQTAIGRDAYARKEIYRTLAEQGEKISALKSEMGSQTISLADLKKQIDHTNERIDAVPAKVISLLRETKNLIT